MDAIGEFVGEGFKSGVLEGHCRAQADVRRLPFAPAEPAEGDDGPFTETKEIIGGYALVEVASREEAMKTARQFMELHRVHWPEFEGECEVRPLED